MALPVALLPANIFMANSTYNNRKANGLCPMCGVNKPPRGYVVCERCRLISKIRIMEMKERKERETIEQAKEVQ